MPRPGRGSRGSRAARPRARHSSFGERRRFEGLVAEALESIPEPFRSRLENVAVVVEEAPSRELLASMGLPPGETLLGLYDGIPLTERGDWYNLTSPDRIVIYRKPTLEIAATAEEIREEVRRTVLHEVAHFYGLGDDDLDEMGYA